MSAILDQMFLLHLATLFLIRKQSVFVKYGEKFNKVVKCLCKINKIYKVKHKMTSVQERLQINRTPLDKWSTREQLCLASAVSCSGDQNWMSVSRTLKLLCGNPKDSLQSRPSDWFSQKNCAVQYGQLLEDVETPKRKKRSSESSVSSSPAPVEPPTDAVLRRLTEERVQELKMEIKKEQEVRKCAIFFKN